MVPAIADEDKESLPDGPGKETTIKVCGKCHGMDVTVSRHESADGWNAIVLQMIKRGAKGTNDQFGEVVDYLAEHFPKSQAEPRIAVNNGVGPGAGNSSWHLGKGRCRNRAAS